MTEGKKKNGENDERKLDPDVQKALEEARRADKRLEGKEQRIFPVLRAKTHPLENKAGKRFVFDEHTAESLIFYALDLDKAFVLIDEQMLADSAISRDEMKEHAMRNVKRLDTFPKKDEVRGNLFYFISRNDGYAASRILNEKYLEQMKRKVKGDMIVAVPHQDVCIVADIRNDHGYKIIFQLNMDFWAKGDIPISPLPFAYGVERQLEPLMMVDHS